MAAREVQSGLPSQSEPFIHLPNLEKLGISKEERKFIARLLLVAGVALASMGKFVADHTARAGDIPQNPQVPTQYDPKSPY